MASVRTCDSCGKQITNDNPLIAKEFIAPIVDGKTRTTHSHYTGHMDIGKCCARELGRPWRKRVTRKAKAS